MESNARDTKLTGAPHGAPARTRVYYVPRKDATPEGELSALAAVYRFVLQHHEKKDARVSEGEEAAERNRTGGTVPKERN
jgi:hypothetical protein